MGVDLRGQTAVVTGASQGLGLVIAKHLLADGANVSLRGRTEMACAVPPRS